jgi:methyl-accepting chemotaxis protein
MTPRSSLPYRLWQRLTGSWVLNPLTQALLHGEHLSAQQASEAALGIVRSLAAATVQQRSLLDAATDEARLLAARGQELRASTERVHESLERARLVALNAALEGARLGEPMGKAVVAMAEEVRTLATRGLEALDEHTESLEYVLRGRDRLHEQLDQLHRHASLASEEVLRVESAQRELVSTLSALGRRIETATGTNSQTAQMLGVAADHARGLLEALTTLSAQYDVGVGIKALAPMLTLLLSSLEKSKHARGNRV